MQRTFATARSVEFDAVLLAGSAPIAPGTSAVEGPDPRMITLVEECFRHAKAIGAWGPGTALLQGAAMADAAGVVVGDSGAEVLDQVQELLGSHRVWDRFGANA